MNIILPLAYVLLLGAMAFTLCHFAFPEDCRVGKRHVALFIMLNVIGFLLAGTLPFGYWIFLLAAVGLILALAPSDPIGRIALFLFLVPLLPNLDHDFRLGIPLLRLNWPSLLVIILLFPIAATALRKRRIFEFPMDKYIWGFFLLGAALAFRDTSLTNGLRGTTYLVIGLATPYLVLSRHLQTGHDIRRVLFPLLTALVFAGLVNVFETLRSWHLYEQLILNVTGDQFTTLRRVGFVRAAGTFTIPSQAAFAQATALGVLWALSPYIKQRTLTYCLLAILAVGLLVTFSRGSWAAAVIIGLGYVFFSISRGQLVKISVLLVILAVPLSQLSSVQNVLSILPFAGQQETEAAGTVAYRESLLETALEVAHQNPVFGTRDYVQDPAFDSIRQSSGLLDLVNHFIIVLLSSGYVGLFLFVSIFLSATLLLIRSLKNSTGQITDKQILERALLFTLLGLLFAITTTSALGRPGLFLWCLVAVTAVTAGVARERARGNQRGRPQRLARNLRN